MVSHCQPGLIQMSRSLAAALALSAAGSPSKAQLAALSPTAYGHYAVLALQAAGAAPYAAPVYGPNPSARRQLALLRSKSPAFQAAVMSGSAGRRLSLLVCRYGAVLNWLSSGYN